MSEGQSITFRTADSSIDAVTVLRGASGARFTKGFGGWVEQARPKRIGATIWNGRPLLGMDVPIMFDGFIDNDPVEIDISRLIRMSWPPKEGSEPPAIRVSGGTPGDTYTWVIEDLEFGDEQIWAFYHGSMVRFRQDCTVKLLQSVDIDVATALRPNVSGQKNGHPRFYVVKTGDTLPKIAVKMYHDRKKWKVIANANNISDPHKIKVGQRLRIP
jgi:LysM repeat protein